MTFSQRLTCASAALLAAGMLARAEPTITSHPAPYDRFGTVERLDPRLDSLLPADAAMQKLATGFDWSEGPVWDPAESRLLFSDIPENTAFQWSEKSGVSIFLAPSGFTGESYDGREPGSNGLTFDLDGSLVLCQHGDRRVARLNERRRGFTTIAAEYQGKRLNSPNDACYDSAGNLYFTDPPYGLAKNTEKELDFQGVYRVDPSGRLTLLTKELERPNGIALSPDEKTLYVANSHGPRPIIMAFPILESGELADGSVFFDSSPLQAMGRRGGNDGLKTDVNGNVWATSAGGLVILSPNGDHLGSLLTERFTANCAFGGPDRSMLYITADDTLLRIQTLTTGYAPKKR